MKTLLLATLTAITLSANATNNICYQINADSVKVGTYNNGACWFK